MIKKTRGSSKKSVKNNRVDVHKIILDLVAVTGVISISLVAPNALQVIKLLGSQNNKRREYYFNTSVERLLKGGLLNVTKNKQGTFLSLTKKGKENLLQYKLGEYKIPISRIWDKKYRIIIFDIREVRRGVRDSLRRYLQQFGFVRLQQSVWVYPYDCHELITLLKTSFRIGREVLYIEASSIENDGWLKKYFNLA